MLSSDKVLGSAYEVVVPQNPPLPYYVAILLDKKRLRRLGEPQTLPFSSSQMGRQLLAVTVELVGADAGPLLLATAHLESTKDEGWWAWGNHRAIGCMGKTMHVSHQFQNIPKHGHIEFARVKTQNASSLVLFPSWVK